MAGSLNKHIAADRSVTWRARVDAGIDPVSGKRKQVNQTFATKKEAELWIASQSTARAEGVRIDGGKQLYSEFLKTWLDGPATRRLHPNSVRCYSVLIHSRISPALGTYRVKELTTAILEQFIHTQEATASPATIRTLGAILRRSLRDAERLGLRSNNPAMLVDGPRIPIKDVQAWSEADARSFLVAVVKDQYAALWRLLLTSGMRIGEALALRWSDLDEDTNTLQIRRTLTRTRAGKLIVGDGTKTAAGQRSVPIDAVTLAALRNHREAQRFVQSGHEDVWQHNDLMFPDPVGRPLDSATPLRRLRSLCKSLGLPSIKTHALRHTCASMLIAGGTNPRAAAELLGHLDPSVTLKTYTRATPHDRRDAVIGLGQTLQEGAS